MVVDRLALLVLLLGNGGTVGPGGSRRAVIFHGLVMSTDGKVCHVVEGSETAVCRRGSGLDQDGALA
jgi:hypothetical protein